MSELEQHDAYSDLPGAPPTPDPPITVEAFWHNAPGTGTYADPDVVTVRAYEVTKDADGTTTSVVAKVVEPPARPTRVRGRQADTKQAAADAPPADPDPADGEATQASASG